MESVYLDPNLLTEDGPRGRYYRVETTVEGSVVLKPVRVPAHVIAERRAQIRRAQIAKRVQHNREQAAIMNRGFVAFMAVAIVICCVVCYFYISLQGEVTSRLRSMTALQTEIEALSIDNDAIEKRMGAREDIGQIKAEAVTELGMQTVVPEQIVYYSVDDMDYMMQYDAVP